MRFLPRNSPMLLRLRGVGESLSGLAPLLLAREA